MKSKEKFIVKRMSFQSGEVEWFWHAENIQNGQILANQAEGHKSRAYTIRKAKEMALGRPVYREDPKTLKLILV